MRKPTGVEILLIAIWAALVAIVAPSLSVMFEHLKALESRTAWICEERSKTIQLSKPEGGMVPVRVLPPGCPKD
jgi:hypothetical protein